MGLYNFQKRFVPFIESGEKTHTIRAKRKVSPKVGETLHLYTGLRQKGARLLMRVPCTKVEDARIAFDDDTLSLWVNEVKLAVDERHQLAQRDGFHSWYAMAEFWAAHALPFEGHIIHWRKP